MGTVAAFFSKRLIQPLMQQLKQGTSPARLAWSVALGAACGLFPVLGATTLLCALTGALFRLNHVALQTVNYLAYAPQLLLIPFFIRVGERLSGAEPIAIDLTVMKARFLESPSLFLQDFGLAAWHGVVAWLVLMPIPAWLAARLLEKLFSRIAKRPAE